MLLYPTTKELMTSYSKFHKGGDNDNLCKLGFVKVMKGNALNTKIGKEILELFE